MSLVMKDRKSTYQLYHNIYIAWKQYTLQSSFIKLRTAATKSSVAGLQMWTKIITGSIRKIPYKTAPVTIKYVNAVEEHFRRT